MRLIPRAASKLYADLFGYFWVPCPVCGTDFGGQEWRDVDGHLPSIPTGNTGYMGMSEGICPGCTAAGAGCRAHAEVGRYHLGCQFVGPPPGWSV
jgi:hypothetical protein